MYYVLNYTINWCNPVCYGAATCCRSASLPMSPANLEALFPAHSKKKRNRQLLLLKQNNSFDSISDKDSPPQSSSSTKSHDRTGKVGTSQLPADFYEQRHSMDKSIQHLLH